MEAGALEAFAETTLDGTPAFVVLCDADFTFGAICFAIGRGDFLIAFTLTIAGFTLRGRTFADFIEISAFLFFTDAADFFAAREGFDTTDLRSDLSTGFFALAFKIVFGSDGLDRLNVEVLAVFFFDDLATETAYSFQSERPFASQNLVGCGEIARKVIANISFSYCQSIMKIVHIITRLIIGGAQENTLLSCQGQHARGHDVSLVTGPPLGPEGSLLERAQSGGYRIIVIDDMRRAISATRDYRTYRTLIQHVTDLKPDIVHTHSSKAGIIGRWAAHAAAKRGASPAVIHTIHGLAFTASTHAGMNYVYKMLEKWAAPITDKIVCVADAMRDQSLAAGIGKPGQYVTVYSGMEIAPFLNPPVDRNTMRGQMGITNDQIIVGTIARLFDLKGHDDLLDLAPALCRRFPQLRFMWVGDGSLRGSFEKRIAEMNLKDRFILTGLVSPARIPELVNAMDIVAHPSRREGLARALPQGSLCACPCVTYDIDGAKEAVLDGKTGFVIPPFDKARFGDAIAKLLEDSALRQIMGFAGRSFASQRFAADTMVDALDREYAGALAQFHAVSK